MSPQCSVWQSLRKRDQANHAWRRGKRVGNPDGPSDVFGRFATSARPGCGASLFLGFLLARCMHSFLCGNMWKRRWSAEIRTGRGKADPVRSGNPSYGGHPWNVSVCFLQGAKTWRYIRGVRRWCMHCQELVPIDFDVHLIS